MVESLYAEDPVEKAFSKASQETGLKFEHETPHLKFLGFGGVYKSDVMEKQYIHFASYQKMNEYEGTRLISNMVNSHMNTTHSSPSLKNYLNNNSFDYKNIEIVLYIQHDNGTPVNHPDIGIFELNDGFISYTTTKPSDKGYVLQETYSKEPYEEALKRIKE